VSLSGRVATFGGRMADAVAEQVLRQFAANFSAALQAQARPAENAPAAAGQQATPAPATPETALNGFALVRAIVRSWLRALFGWRRA
jgi:hypothetical protein